MALLAAGSVLRRSLAAMAFFAYAIAILWHETQKSMWRSGNLLPEHKDHDRRWKRVGLVLCDIYLSERTFATRCNNNAGDKTTRVTL